MKPIKSASRTSTLSSQNLIFLRRIERLLDEAGVSCVRFEAEQFVTEIAGMNRLELMAGFKPVCVSKRRKILSLVRRRRQKISPAHLLGRCWFGGLRFYIDKRALIPRQETELLVDETQRILDKYYAVGSMPAAPRILDLCTGSGAIAICLTSRRPDCTMTALDRSAAALQVARKNLKLHKLENKVRLLQGDLFNRFSLKKRPQWDIIVTNPPYIPAQDYKRLPAEVRREPRIALDGGPGGTQIIDKILTTAGTYLTPNGWLLMEVCEGQKDHIENKIQELHNGLRTVRWIKDLNGIDRHTVIGKS